MMENGGRYDEVEGNDINDDRDGDRYSCAMNEDDMYTVSPGALSAP
jgi:hypothetical protein